MKKLLLLMLLLLAKPQWAGNPDKEKKNVRQISGRVTDQQGQVLAGAKILVLETGDTFYTDLEGRFIITLQTGKTYSIEVNTIGYLSSRFRSAELHNFSELSLEEL